MQRSYSYDSNLVLRTVYLPRELDDRLRQLAFEQHKSKNEVIRSLLFSALAGLGQIEAAQAAAAQTA